MASPGRDRYWDPPLGTPLAREAPACPRCSGGSCGGGPAPEPRLPPRPAAGPERWRAALGPRNGPGGGAKPPRRPLCPARGTARFRAARHSPYRAEPCPPALLASLLLSARPGAATASKTCPVPSPPALPPPLPPRAASRRRGGCSARPCPGSRLRRCLGPTGPRPPRVSAGREEGKGCGSTSAPDAFRSHGDRELRGFRQEFTQMQPVICNFPVSSAAKNHVL